MLHSEKELLETLSQGSSRNAGDLLRCLFCVRKTAEVRHRRLQKEQRRTNQSHDRIHFRRVILALGIQHCLLKLIQHAQHGHVLGTRTRSERVDAGSGPQTPGLSKNWIANSFPSARRYCSCRRTPRRRTLLCGSEDGANQIPITSAIKLEGTSLSCTRRPNLSVP